MADARIGLQALFEDAQFKAGIANYNKSVQQATQATDQGAKQITQSTQGIGQAWQGMATVVGGLISGYMVKKLGEAIWSLGELGATTLRQRTAFDELARQAGGSSDAILAAVKRATDGTVADADIILSANKGILLGLGAQADQWEKLSEVARFRARAMGLSVTQALSDITTGIGRQSKLILDNLGIILDTEQVYADYAGSIGKAADALSDAEKKQAFLTSVITDGQAQIAAAGGIVTDYADNIEAMNAELENAKVVLAEGLAPAVSDVAIAIKDLIPILSELVSGPVATLVTEFAGDLQQLIGSMALYSSAASGKIGWGEAIAADIEAAKIKTNEGTEAMMLYIQTVTGTSPLIEEAAQGWMASIGGVIPVTDRATEAAQKYAAALAGVNVVISDVEPMTEAQVKGTQRRAKAYQDQLKENEKAAQKAEQERIKNQEKALQEMQRNEEQYANALGQLYDQIVSVQEQANQDRIQEERDYAQAALQLEQDLARERAKITQDLDRDIKDNRRKERQKEVDSATDLARDLEDLTTKLAARNEATWAEYYATIEQLTLEHGDKMAALTERQAAERAAVEKKYQTEPEPPSLDAQREALQEELRLMQEQQAKTGMLDKQREYEALQALEALKTQELALLDEAQAAELAAEELAWQEQQAKAQERRDAELAANQADYDAQAAQRQLAYDRQIDDLRLALQREQDERRLAARRELDDLRARGDQERAELSAQHQARLGEIERGLQAETDGFRGAYATQLSDLQTYLNQRTQQWRDHQAAIEGILGIQSPSKWMEDIGKQLRAGLDVGFQGPSIATDLQSAVANFGRSVNNLSLPMGSGGGSSSMSSVQNVRNYNLSADFSNSNAYPGIRDQFRLMEFSSGR